MNKCEHCEKEFSSEPVLKKHQRTAKYCLALRNVPIENVKTYDCDYCEYSTTQKSNLTRHTSICKYKLVSEKKDEDDIRVQNLLLKKEIEIYKLEASKPKITNNNNITFTYE
jgi:hypothetical protein